MNQSTSFRLQRHPCQIVFLVTLSLGVICCTIASATLPVVNSLEPRGVVRGEETVIKFTGTRLGDASEVLCDLPGIEILEIKAVSATVTEVKLRAAADLTPGLYPIRLVTKSGIGNLRLLGVGAMPVVLEAEPNDTFDTPQTIELNRTIDGLVKREDVDHYQVQLVAGQTLNVEIEGIRIANSLRNQNILDPYLAILDEDQSEVATSDDSALLQQDGFCSYTAPADGTYRILVRDSSFLGSDVGGYRLHVGTYSRPVAVIPAGGPPATVLDATLVLSDGTQRTAKIPLPSEPQALWGVSTEDENGITPSPNWIRVNDLPVALEQEPNDDRRSAPVVAVPGAYCGVVEKPGDYDCFTFAAKKGTKYRVEVFARNVLRSPLDAVLNVFDPKHATLVSSDDSRGRIDPFVDFDAKEDGNHTVRIYDHLSRGGFNYAYRIEVTTPEPGVKLTLNELRRYEPEVVSVPIGGSVGMVVAAERDRYNGAVHLSLEGLPAGVTATTFPMPAGRPEVPVLLTASADAKHNASLFTIYAKGDESNPLIGGKLNQRHRLVLGQNQREMWGYDTDRAAMAVTDEVPFTLEFAQPKTPIVRSGAKDFVIKINKKEGFDETVSFKTLYSPPGISINNSRSIAKGKTEVEIPITANGSAAIGTWPIIFIASYNSASGPAVTATTAIMLDVEDSIFKPAFPKTAGEVGAEINLTLPIEILREYQGEAEIELVGIPAGVTSPAAIQKITPQSESVTFPLVIDAAAKVGRHNTLYCKARITVDGETIIQNNGPGELRIDAPLPVKQDADKPAPVADKPAQPKPLSRLEQLRQNKQ